MAGETTRRGFLAGIGAGIVGLTGSVVTADADDGPFVPLVTTLPPIESGEAIDSAASGAIRFSSISRREATVEFDGIWWDNLAHTGDLHLYLIAQVIGSTSITARGTSVLSHGEQIVKLPLAWEDHDSPVVLHLIGASTPSLDELTEENALYLTASDPIEWSAGSVDPHPVALSPTVADDHVVDHPGRFTLSFDPPYDEDDPIRVAVAKWALLKGRNRRRPMYIEPIGRRWAYVEEALNSGAAQMLAQSLAQRAYRAGYTTKREQAVYAIRFVQSLAYRRDPISMGVRDYSRFVEETLVDGGGDCVDTSILMAAILRADPFKYDLAFLAPPSHMAVGIRADEFPGWHVEHEGRRYYYIETTGFGWRIGSLPTRYQDTNIRVYHHPFSKRGRSF